MSKSITLTQAALIAGRDASTLRRACEKGEILGAELLGKTWVVTEKAIISWRDDPTYHKTGPKGKVKDSE